MKGRVSIPHRIEKNRNIRNRIIEVVTVSIPHRIEKNGEMLVSIKFKSNVSIPHRIEKNVMPVGGSV